MKAFYHGEYYFELPPEHPFPMDKFRDSHRILSEECPRIAWRDPSPATWDDVRRVHHQEYLEQVAQSNLSKHAQFRLGLPAGKALLERCRFETGGTIGAVENALSDGVACNLGGGTHHAFPSEGFGYCVLNDVAIAVRRLQVRKPELRIFVADTDAHQGNGTHFILKDASVFTYSIHVGKNYPTMKEPGDLDVPLERQVKGAAYLQHLEKTLPAAIDRFDPDLLIWISGADPHEDDRFGQMELTTADLARRDEMILRWHQDFEVPIAVLYGGGYNRAAGMTARLHANTIRQAYRWEALSVGRAPDSC